MREIKFRAWDKISELMYFPNGDKIFITLTGSVCPVENEKDNWSYCENRSYRNILMQFTGLKDKNGKEIYEGDIVKGGVYHDFDVDKIGVVKFGQFEADSSGGEYGSVTCQGYFVDPISISYEYYDRKFNNKNIEVIGNIYENPQLLEEK